MSLAKVLCVDDDATTLKIYARHLQRAGLTCVPVADPNQALEAVRQHRPHLMLLDANMPEVDGYEVLESVRRDPAGRNLPVVFVTAADRDLDRKRAESLGAADFLTKPISGQRLLAAAQRHLRRERPVDSRSEAAAPKPARSMTLGAYLVTQLKLTGELAARVRGVTPQAAYTVGESLGLLSKEVAELLAAYAGLPYAGCIDVTALETKILPPSFCHEHQMALVTSPRGDLTAVLCNPFDLQLMDLIRTRCLPLPVAFAVTEPEQMMFLFASPDEGGTLDAVSICDHILRVAAVERASDIHIEPKDSHVLVNLRIDGQIRPAMNLSHVAALRVLSRLKLLGQLDIAERRRPQDGSCSVKIGERDFQLRLATAATPAGESMIIRLLATDTDVPELSALGMTEAQAGTLQAMIRRSHGLILIVGTTGSGKSTTAYSLLSHLRDAQRSVLTIEDPVEYKIPFANQQQVNDKAGITFAALLKSAVRQDPDVLFLGEVRDSESAHTATYMASTGHLTVATLHTADVASAVGRLERLGVDRRTLADALLGLVAQRLVRRLCSSCRSAVRPTEEQIAELAHYGYEAPQHLGEPIGCNHCSGRGYRGRVGVYEILSCDGRLADELRGGNSVAEIRRFLHQSGCFMMGHHALTHLRRGVIGYDDAIDVIASGATQL